ncbi:MAG: DUF2892 domain-containing protein [Zetaproteobacteria bacterium]|nr:MAG: DUF2892 domain-containing protein [Zetaproteobacteria bacterium]
MKANVGGIDRAIRFLAGAGLLAWGLLGGLAQPWNYVADGVGAVMLLTSLLRFCPLYPLLGINTCGNAR